MNKINEFEKEVLNLLNYTFDEEKNIILDQDGEVVGNIKHNENGKYYVDFDSTNFRGMSKCNSHKCYGRESFNLNFKNSRYVAYTLFRKDEESSEIYLHSFGNKEFYFRVNSNTLILRCQMPYQWYFEISFSDIRKITDYENYKIQIIYNEKKIRCEMDSENEKIMNIKTEWERKPEQSRKFYSNVEGSLQEVISEVELGIEMFNHMRFYINKLPLKEDLILWLIKNTKYDLPELLEIYIPDIKKEKQLIKIIS